MPPLRDRENHAKANKLVFGAGKFASGSNWAISKSEMTRQQRDLEDYNITEGERLKNA